MNTNIKNHQWIMTEDGSSTLYSEVFQEACHSPAGAKAETELHYIQGCKIKEKIKELNQLSILEVGFGTGLGLKTTFEALKDDSIPIFFVSLEIDSLLVEHFFGQPEIERDFQLEWIVESGVKYLQGSRNNFHYFILTGNARKTLPLFLNTKKIQFNAIYQDAFSPGRNPVLWTKEWFELLKSQSSPDVILSTYSASNSIRNSMVDAGWKVYAGEKFGTKRASTRARLVGESDADILDLLNRSPAKAILDADVAGEHFE